MTIRLPNLKYYSQKSFAHFKAWPGKLGLVPRQKKVWAILLVVVLLAGLILIVLTRKDLSFLEDVKKINAKTIPQDPVLSKVTQLYELPDDNSGSFGKIKDPKALTQKHKSLKKAKEGDILIFYPDLTIIYDPVNKVVVDITKEKI